MSRRRRRVLEQRDQATSPFGAALMGFCDACGASGAALVDAEGETVDYAGYLEPFQIKITAAEWRLVFQILSRSPFPGWSETHELVVRARHHSYVVVTLTEGYAVVAQLPRHSFNVSRRAVSEAVRELSREAGLPYPDHPDKERRAHVEVRTVPGDDRRPAAVWFDGSWCELTILGRYNDADLARREIGYRARLASGAEITLVRERTGRWYADGLPGV